MISNREIGSGSLPTTAKGPMRFFVADSGANLGVFSSWKETTMDEFKKMLITAADSFPLLPHGENENQSHVTLLVHGFNVGWVSAANAYQSLCSNLYSGPNSLGICVSFDWPSLGSVLGYFPDRDHARDCATDLTTILCSLYEWLLIKQSDAKMDASKACKAKVSIIAHSMGNYLLQKAISAAWARVNKPLTASLINQLLMVAADVDNNLFEPSSEDATDGTALSNLSYRISCLYSGRDAVLNASAGLKHFGTRRLGRSGLSVVPPSQDDNVWEVDCSSFFDQSVTSIDIHGEYFREPGTLSLIRQILRGIDRGVLDSIGATIGKKWPP